MAVILLIVLLGLGVVLAAALGSGWGPAILGLGFGGWALLVLLPGYGWPWTLFGVIYFTLAIAELFAAYGFWSWQDGSATALAGTRRHPVESQARPGRPPLSWRLTATLIGLGGFVGLFYQLGLIFEASICALTLNC